MEFDENLAFQIIEEQLSFGPRMVGSDSHKKFHSYLENKLKPLVDDFHPHIFEEKFFNTSCVCKNIGGTIYGRNNKFRILLGSHFDIRPYADEDPDESNHKKPVPGANDGASGVAVLFELARLFRIKRPMCNLEIVFFDAEDWNNIDGKEVSLGSHRYVEDNIANLPDKVIIVDMVGGKNLNLDFDLHGCIYKNSELLALKLFRLGNFHGYPAYKLTKPDALKYIVCDHIPFLIKRIPATILIDIDYPQWHTVSDTIENCDPYSLKQAGQVLYEYLK